MWVILLRDIKVRMTHRIRTRKTKKRIKRDRNRKKEIKKKNSEAKANKK